MRNKLLLCLVCVFSPMMGLTELWAQANKTRSGDVNCPASGTSIEVVAANSSRYSIIINNISNTAIRVGYLDSGSANLTASNSWVMQPGQAYADSAPGVLMKRIVCMSTSGVAMTISFNETYR